jgi:mannose-1-phosphate guanylyltransferase
MALAILLAGGEGSRLRPLTHWIPKPLLPIDGKPLLLITLERLALEGWDRVIVCVNSEFQSQFEFQIRSYLRSVNSSQEVIVSALPNSYEIGTSGEIASVIGLIHEPEFLWMNGDVLCSFDTRSLGAAMRGSSLSPLGALAVSMDLDIPKGVVELDSAQPTLIRSIREKPTIRLPNLPGIELLRRECLSEMKVGEDIHRDVLPRLISKGGVLLSVPFLGGYVDIGTVDSYERAQSRGSGVVAAGAKAAQPRSMGREA